MPDNTKSPIYQILINKTPISHITPDVSSIALHPNDLANCLQIVLLGDADVIVQFIMGELGWKGRDDKEVMELNYISITDSDVAMERSHSLR